MSARKDTPLRRWRRSIKKIGLLAVLAGLAPTLSADSHSPAELPAAPAAVSAESALSALSDGFLYSDYLQNLPNLQTETTPVVSGFHGSFAVENRPSLLESIADGLPARLRQEAQSVPLRQWGLGWAIDSRRPEVTPALAAGGWRLANWLGKEVLLSATDKYGIQTLEFDLQSELGGRRAAIGVNALGALRQTERNAIAWQLSGFKSKDGVGGNVGGLYRWVTPDENHLLGANLFLDYEDYEAGAFNRWSLGGEWRSAWVDAFANVYRGITDSKLHKGERYYTADGYELEVNVHSPNVAWIAGALTYYNWKGENGDSDEDGVRFGLKFTPTLPLLLEVEYDDGDSRDNDWGGRIVYSGEFGGVQSPSVHRRGGEFVPRDFFFAAANREYTQRIRKVENNLPSPLPGRVIDLGQRGTTAANHADIVIRGIDITLTLDYMNAAPAHYIKEGLEFGVSVAASVTVSLAAKYTVQSAATVVTVQSTLPFAVETGAGTEIRTLFIGSTVALAETYAHLIHGRVSLSSGGESYEVRRNIKTAATIAATYDSFILPPAAILTVVSPVPNFTDPITLSNPEGIRIQRFSDDPNIPTVQINLSDRLFNPQINDNAIAPTGGNGNYTISVFGAPGQATVLMVSPAVLRGYRITATLAGNQVKFDRGEDLTLTVNIPSSGDTKGIPHTLRIERDDEAGFPVPKHVNTVRFAYQRIDNLEIALHDPQSGTGDPLRFVTLGAAAVASVSVNGGDPTTRAQRIVFGDNVFSLNGDILSINAPAHGAYTVSVEVFDRFPDADLSPPMTAGLTVLFTTILAPVRGSWRFDGRELGTHATVTIHRTANPPAVTIGSLVPRGGDGNYKTHELRGTDASLVEFDGNNLVIKDSTNPAAGNGNEIDFEVVIDDTSDPALPIATLAVPTTLTLKLFYVQVNALAAAVETPSGVSGTVLAAAAVPGAATPAASVAVSGGDGNATVQLAAGGDASFAVDSANRIVWTPRAFGKATVTLAVRDGLTGLPGGTDEQNPVVVAELIRAASLSFDGEYLTPDSGVASLTVTLYFDEEIPQAERRFATLTIASGYDELGAPVFDASGDEFYALHNDGRLEIKATTRAEVSPKTGIIRINYRQTDNSKPPLINPNGHRYAVRLESAYRPITLKAYTPDGSAEIDSAVRVLTNNATVASLVATGGQAGRNLQVLAGDFELIDDNTKLRLKVADGATTPSAFSLYTVTLRYADNRGNGEELILTVDYVDQTPPLVLGFAGGIGNGGNIVVNRTAAGSVRFATLTIGGGFPPFVVGKESTSANYDFVDAPPTSRSRILYIPDSVTPTDAGLSFVVEITVSDNDDTASPAQSVTVNVRYVKVPEVALALAVRKPTAEATPAAPVRWFTEFASPPVPSLVASLDATGGGEGARAVITAAPPGDIFDLTDENILRFAPTAKGIYTLTLAAMDNVGNTPATETVTVAYGDPILASMKSGGHDESVQNGTLSNGGTVIFHNYFGNAGRPGLTDLPIATLAASGGFGGYTYTWQDSSTGTPGNDSGYVVVSNGILWLNRFDSGGQNAPGTGRAIESTPEFVATITVNDGFDASPPVLLSITGAAFQHRRPANKPDPENPRIQLEQGGNVFALHTDTGETPTLTLGLPSTLAIGSSGLAIATVRVGGGYSSKNLRREGGSNELQYANPITDPDPNSDDSLYDLILDDRDNNLADFPADANGESGVRSVVLTYRTRYLGRDFFDSSIQEPHEATVSLKFKIKKITALRESAALIAAANAKIPDNIASGNLIREASDNTGNIDIARTDNTLTYAGLTLAKMTYKNLVGLGGKRSFSDLLEGRGGSGMTIGIANSILTITTGSADNEIFVKTRVPAAHAASHPFTPGIGGANGALDGGFVVNVSRFTPEPLRVEVLLTDNTQVTGPLEFLRTSASQVVDFRRARGAGGTGNGVQIKVAPVVKDVTIDGGGFDFADSILMKAPLNRANIGVTFDVDDAPDSSWPDGVDFTPQRRFPLNFVGKNAAELSCGSGGTRGETQRFFEPGANETVGTGNTRLNLSQGLTGEARNSFRRQQNVYVSHAGTFTDGVDERRYSRCDISPPDGAQRYDFRCVIRHGKAPLGQQSTPDGDQRVVHVRGGDVLLLAPRFSGVGTDTQRHDARSGETGQFASVLENVKFARAQTGNAHIRHSNLFRVYHKPGVGKPGRPADLELFAARGEYGDDRDAGCHTRDLAADGSEGFYLTDNFVQTYKWQEAVHQSILDQRSAITTTRGRTAFSQEDYLDSVACTPGGGGGNMGRTQRFSEPIPGAGVGGNYEHSPGFNVNHWIVQSTALIDRTVRGNSVVHNFHVRHKTSTGDNHARYSQCGLTANRDLTCQVRLPPSGFPANPVITVRAGDVLLVAPGKPQELPEDHIRHFGGSGKFDSAINYLGNVCKVEATCGRNQYFAEKDANIMRVYHKRDVRKRTFGSEAEIFIARGEHGSDHDAGCFTEDLPTSGSKFYLDRNFVRTYKWREAVPQRILDERRTISSLQNRPAPVPFPVPPAPSP